MRPGSNAFPSGPIRPAWREPGEPKDERPSLRIGQFWDSPEQDSAYLSAVRDNPREVDPEADTIESSMHYIVRIAGIVEMGPLAPAAKRMPKRWQEKLRPAPNKEPDYEQRLEAIFAPSTVQAETVDREPGSDG